MQPLSLKKLFSHIIILAAAAGIFTPFAPDASAGVVSPGAKLLPSYPHTGQRDTSPLPSPADVRADASGGEDEYIPLIVKLNDPQTQLPEGVVELYRRGDLMLAYVRASILDELGNSGYFSRMEGRGAAAPTLDKARTFTGYDRILAAEGLPRQYAGRGVTVGFTDAGFDPHHIEFADPATGRSRVRSLTHYSLNPDENVRLTTPEEISAWTTDDRGMYHAAHVAGIMAGGYMGNDYYGIAPQADIAASTSALYDALLLSGMEDVIADARRRGQPAVINMSISCGTGPHDGTSLFSQYLSRLAEEATICISSGNDGMRRGLFTHTFADSNPTALTLLDIYYASWYAAGPVDVWSCDDSPLNFTILIYDRETSAVVHRLPLPPISPENPEIHMEFPDELAEYMEGSVAVASEINPSNGRFNATFLFDLYNYPLPDDPQHRSLRYVAGLEISGEDGQSVIVYSGDQLMMKVCPGYEGAATSNGAINDFITGSGVIGVGALTSRTTWPMADGSTGSSSYVEGKIADFSGFWKDGSGPVLPDIVAPGAHLISAVSSPYAAAAGSFIPSYSETVDGEEYHWGSCCGTSMSSPYVAGVCALMLEANPDLTPAEIKEIILQTAATPEIEPYSPRWGRGVLDSHACVKAALSRASLPVVPTDSRFGTGFDESSPFEVYTVAGILVGRFDTLGSFQSSPLPPGLYLLRQGSAAAKHLHR